MKVLFVCNQNKNRSKTAEMLFKDSFDVRSAGLFGGKIITKQDILWSDVVAVMEEEQRIELVKRFPNECMKKRVIDMNVSDYYSYGQQELVEILTLKKELI